MIGHETRIGCRMARLALYLGRTIELASMASQAKNRAIIEIKMVPGQAKLGQQIMLERLQFIGGYGRLPSLMFDMAVAAIPGIRQAAV